MWTELPHGLSLGQCWNLYWSYCPPNIDFSNLFAFQKVNHLINNRIVHRKDLLHKHIMRVRKLNKKCNEFFDIMPLTFLLSKEYVNFVEEFHKIKDTDDFNIWIVKPVGKSRGKGMDRARPARPHQLGHGVRPPPKVARHLAAPAAVAGATDRPH